MSTIANNPPALGTPLATTREPADQWASHTIQALSRDDNAPPDKQETPFQSHSTATTPGQHIPGAYPAQTSELSARHATAEVLQSDAEYVKDAALSALHTAKEYVGSAGETVGGYLPPSVAAYLPGGHAEHTVGNPGSLEPTHHIRDVAHAIVPPSTSEEIEDFGLVPGPAAVHNSQSSPAQYLHPHSTLAANPPIETLVAEGATGDASTKSLPGSRVETPASFSDTPPGLACSNGRGEHHAAHSQLAEDRTHQPSGFAATVLPEVPPPVSLNQPVVNTPSKRELGQEGSSSTGFPLAEIHQRSFDAEQERGAVVGEENVPTHVVAGKTEMRTEEPTNVISEEERLGFGSVREKEKGRERPTVTLPPSESESMKARKERTLREELAALQVSEQEGPSTAPSTSLQQPATMTRIRTTLEPGEKDRPFKPPTEAELKARRHAETMPLKAPEKREHRKSFIDKLKEKIHVGGKEKKAAPPLQQQQEGIGEVLEPQSKN